MEKMPDCKHLFGTLFAVPFAAIQVPQAEGDSKDYKFSNPRMNTEKGQEDLMDKGLSADLRDSIKAHSLLNPLICRWVEDEDGNRIPQLVGGDRRYRALDFLIRKKEIVTDGKTGEQLPADQVYEFVPCQVFTAENDLDALALSWSENKSRINLTEGHEIAEVMNLRKFKATDKKILEILQRDEKWLRESDRLIDTLDKDTLYDFIENKMTRDCAIALASIEDVEKREQVKVLANQAAKETYNRKIERFQKQLGQAIDEVNVAEGHLAEAQFNNDESLIEEATQEQEEALEKIRRVQGEQEAIVAVTSAKEVRTATRAMRDEDQIKMLRLPKVKAGAEYLDALIAAEGKCLDGKFEADEDDLRAFKLARMIVKNNILANDDDFAATIQFFVESKN